MRAALAILGFFVRWMLRAVYVFSTIVACLLAGYWLGWKSVSPDSLAVATVESETASNRAAAPVEEASGQARRRASEPGRDAANAEARLVRLARSLITEPDERAAQARAIVEISTMDRGEVLNALAALEGAPATGPTFALREMLLQRLVDLDPHAALQYAREKNGSSRAFEAIASRVLWRWASTDPAAALSAWRDLEMSSRARSHVISTIFRNLGNQDLRGALVELETLPQQLRAEAWRGLAQLAAEEKHREQVLAALSALPPGGLRSTSLGVALREWAREANPTEALQWLESTSLPRDERARIEQDVGFGFFYQDHRMAADWIMARAQDPEERADRLASVVAMWATFDVVGAGQWLIEQGLDNTAGPAMAHYARAIVADYPAEAIAWARNIPDERVRERALAHITKCVREYHPRKADALLAMPR